MSPDIGIIKFVANPKFKFAVIRSSFLSGHLFGITIKEFDSSGTESLNDIIKFS